MGMWTYVLGTIEVSPCGRTQYEKDYILKTILAHLPRVAGMEVHIAQEEGTDQSSSTDEFFCNSNLLDKGLLRTQGRYLITVKASIRNRWYGDVVKDFQKWLYRLSKRASVSDVLVNVKGWGHSTMFTNKNNYYSDLYFIDDVPWCWYLMWDYETGKDGGILCGKPMEHTID